MKKLSLMTCLPNLLCNLCMLFIFLLCNMLINAQITGEFSSIEWSERNRKSRTTAVRKVLGADDNTAYIVKTRVKYFVKDEILVESHDLNTMRVKKSAVLPLKYKNKKMQFEFIVFFNDRLWLFTSYNNSQRKKNYLMRQEIDTQSLQVIGDLIKVSEISSKSWINRGDFQAVISHKKSKLLIFNSPAYNKNAADEFSLTVFDENMEQLWTKNVTVPYKDKLFGFEKLVVDEEGNAYVQSIIYEGKAKKMRMGRPNYSYKIFSYTDLGTTANEYPVRLDNGRFITDLTFGINRKGNIICGGFYSDENAYTIRGTYFLTIDQQSKAIMSEGTKAFEADFLQAFFSERKAKSGKELANYYLDDIILRNDGGALLFAEQYYERVITNPVNTGVGPPQYQTSTRYYYTDIIVISINPDNSIDWATKVPKRHVSTDDGGYYSSYAKVVSNKKIYLVFNDYPKDIPNLNTNKLVFTLRNGFAALSVVAIAPDGSYEKERLMLNRDEGVTSRPRLSEQVNKNTLIMYGDGFRKYQIGKLTFD